MAVQDGTVLTFGIGTPLTSYGLLQSVNITEQIERATARGASGNTVSVQEFDDTKTLTMNFMELGTQTSPPTVGTAFTYDSIEWLIDSIDQGETVDGFKTWDVTATHYPNLPA